MSKDITLEQLQGVVPKRCKKVVTTEFVNELNNLTLSQEAKESYRDNLLGYAEVLSTGKYSIQAYVNAVRYVTFKLFDDTNLTAFIKAFPDRYQDMINKNYADKDINSVISAYNKSQLVVKIFEMTLVPSHILNADLHQKAINHLAYLMLNARSEKVQSDSASKLVDVLKIPETAKIELDIKVGQDSVIDDLRQSTLELVKQQRLAIESGASNAEAIAGSKIINSTAEVIDE